MALDNSSAQDKGKRKSKRKPTRRAKHVKTAADSHYSKLTRKPSSDTTGPIAGTATGGKGAHSDVSQYQTLYNDAERKVYGQHSRKRRKSSSLIYALLALWVIGAFIYGGYRFWMRRSVPVTVNMTFANIRINSTLDELYDQAGITTTPGNYVSVNGNLLEEGKGYAYSVTVDTEHLTREQIDEYRIKGGEHIDFGTGDNRTEPFETTYEEEQPKLVFEGEGGAVSYVKQWGTPRRLEVRTGTVSQEMTEAKEVSTLQDCIVVSKNIHPANDEKLVALTFDDGPSEAYTEQCLGILAERGVKATFFHIAKHENEHPELTKKIVDAGHQVCNHTLEHLDLTTLGQEDFTWQIAEGRRIISEVAGVETTIVRPPYFCFDQNSWLMTNGAVSATINCNQNTNDTALPGVDAIVNAAVTDIFPGAIILMHDGGEDRTQTMEALPQVIDRLTEQGYSFVTISELLASDPEIPEDIASCNATLPEGAVWPTEIRV